MLYNNHCEQHAHTHNSNEVCTINQFYKMIFKITGIKSTAK